MAAAMHETERMLRDKMASAHDKMRAVMEKQDRGEALTVEDRATFDQADAALVEAKGDLKRHLDWRQAEETKDAYANARGMSRDEHEVSDRKYKDAYLRYLVFGSDGLSNEARSLLYTAKYEDRGLAGYSRGDTISFETGETRVENPLSTAPASGVDGSAGFLVPQGFWMNLQIALKAYGGLMGECNMIKTATGNPMPWPTTDPTQQVGSYIGENAQLQSNTTIEFGQGMMHAWFIKSGVIQASLAIINDSAFDVNGFVTDRMGEQIGRKVAQELHTGAGAASSALTGINPSLAAWNQTNTAGATPANGGYYQPANAVKAFWFGASGGTTATATLGTGIVDWGSFIGLQKTVDPAYRQSGRCIYVMNDVTEGNVRQLTDGLGHPLWEPDVQVGPSDGPIAKIEGFRVLIDQNTENVPTAASTAGGVLFGDFKTAMLVRQVQQAGTMRLTERYADFLQVGFLSYVRMDSLPNDLRAVAQYKTNAS